MIDTQRAISFFVKGRDLAQLEKALKERVEKLSAFKIPEHENTNTFLALQAEGVTIIYKPDTLQAEIQHCEILLEKIQLAILSQ